MDAEPTPAYQTEEERTQCRWRTRENHVRKAGAEGVGKKAWSLEAGRVVRSGQGEMATELGSRGLVAGAVLVGCWGRRRVPES